MTDTAPDGTGVPPEESETPPPPRLIRLTVTKPFTTDKEIFEPVGAWGANDPPGLLWLTLVPSGKQVVFAPGEWRRIESEALTLEEVTAIIEAQEAGTS